MSKPLPSQNTFASVAPPWNLSLLDANLANAWAAINDYGTYSLLLADTGVVNALVVTPAAGLTLSLFTGLTLDLAAANTTTSAAPTLNANGTGVKTIVDYAGNSLFPGALVASGIYRLVYDGTNYRCQNPSSPMDFGIHKAAVTSRASTTTMTNDPDLQVTIPAAGTFAFEIVFYPYMTAGPSTNMNVGLNFSGTFTAIASGATLFAYASPISLDTMPMSSSPSSNPQPLNQVAIGAPAFAADGHLIRGTLTAAATGLLGFAWAQNSSSATAANIGPGSYIQVTRV